jgi:small subunit ribosomal protein S21
MAIRIKARAGESAEQMLRRFKKMCEKEGLTKDVKKHAYYEKPSERRRRAMRKSVKRTDPTMMNMKGGPGSKFAKGGKDGKPGARPGPGGPRPPRAPR